MLRARSGKDFFIEDELKHRILGAYALLLIGSWLIDLSLDPQTPRGIRAIISGFKWMVTAPLMIAITAAAIGLVIFFAIGICQAIFSRTGSTTPAEPQQISTEETFERWQVEQNFHDEEQKRKEEERVTERKRREVVAAEERARFHHVKQTRSADDAAKASLDEF